MNIMNVEDVEVGETVILDELHPHDAYNGAELEGKRFKRLDKNRFEPVPNDMEGYFIFWTESGYPKFSPNTLFHDWDWFDKLSLAILVVAVVVWVGLFIYHIA